MIAMSNNPWLDIASYQTSDAYRFKGRDEDITKFYNIIENGHLSVLYAESGIGKTSFLNAGIIPALGEQDYAPIHIVFPDDVFTDAQLDIRQWVFDTIENEVKKTGLEWKFNLQDQESDLDTFLWWRLHACQLTDEAGTVKKPLLIFDQFEEVFIKSNRDGNENLLTSMFSYIQQLSSHNVPNKVLDVLNRLYEEKQIQVNYNRNSEYKIIFSLRKEYLSDFDYWTNDRYSVTELFQNRMYLRPFSREQARQVICEQEGVSALNDVAGKIIESIDPNNHNEVEPFVLSVLCSRLFSEAQRRGKDKLAASDFDEVNVNNIIRDFYEDTISTIVTKRSHVAALETLLVDEDGVRTRIRVNQAELQKLGFEKSYKQKLDDSHLIRIIKINDNDYVELIHDRIAKAIYEKRNERQKKNRRIGLRLLLVALYLFVLWFTYHNVMESENEQFCESYPYTKYVDKTKRANIDGEVPFHGNRGYYHCFDYQNLDYLEEVVVSEDNVHLCVGNCPKLERVIIQEGIDSVTLNLKGCPKLSFVSIPHSVKYIGLFIERCPVLFNINIPNEEAEIASWSRISSDVLSVTTKNPRYPWKDGVLWDLQTSWRPEILYMRARSHGFTYLDAPEVILRDTLFVVRNCLHHGGWKGGIRKINGLKISTDAQTIDLRGMDIENVPYNVFNAMPNLKEVYLPKSIVEIKGGTFQNCKKLELVNFEDCPNLRRIDSYAFKDCEKLKSVNLSNCSNELAIEPFAFEDCQGIEYVSFPQSMDAIYDWAFKSCRSISSTKLPDTINHVGYGAFEDCIQLRKVSLPCSVNIFNIAFPACVNLKEIELNNNPSFLYNESDSCLLFNGSPCIFNKVKYHTYNDNVCRSKEGILYDRGLIIDIPQGNKSCGAPFLSRGAIIDNRVAIDSILTIVVSDFTLFYSNSHRSDSFSFLFPPENIKQINFKYSSYPHIVDVIHAIPDSLRQNISIKVPYNCKDWFMYNPDIAGIRSVSEDSYLEAWTFLFVDTLQDAIRLVFGESRYYWQIILGIVALLAFVVYMLYRERSSRKKKSLQSSSVIQKVFALLLGFVFWYIIYWFVWLTVTSSESFHRSNEDVLQIGAFVIALVISVVSVSFLLYPKESNLKMMNKIADFFRGLKRRITR